MDDIKTHLEAVLEKIKELELDKAHEPSIKDRQQNEIDFPYRVIHFKNNPFQQRLDVTNREIKRLTDENKRLLARLELLEAGNNADVTRRIDEVVNNTHEIDTLKKKLVEYEKREAKILTSFRQTSREFREVCYLLTGFRIDALKNRIYRLTNMYAESQEDKLMFEISPQGDITLLQNEYTKKLPPHLIMFYLEQCNSFPAFLSSITLDLFKSSTQMFQVSMNISTSKDSTMVAERPMFRK